jgi:hypothetical protein
MNTTLDYLLPEVRVLIGDLNSTSYRYLDEWLLLSLAVAVKRYQRYYTPPKYVIDNDGNVSRNVRSTRFTTDESEEGTIEKLDEPILALIAAIVTLEGGLENSAWNIVSWKDSEVSFNNNESGRMKDNNLSRLKNDLSELIKSPTKRLAGSTKSSLPGYLNNSYEHEGDY